LEVTNNPHDRFFKEIFKKKQNVIDLLYNALPKEIYNEIDFTIFEYSEDSYIDEKLKEVQTDLLIRTTLKGEKCAFYILFEHKAYSDRFALFQLLNYMVKIWRKEIKNKSKYLTPIIPILFYQSDHRWKHHNRFSIYFEKPNDLLKSFIPNLEYIIYDLKVVPNDSLKGNFWFISAIRLMKHIHKLKPILEEIYNFILNNADLSKDYPEDLITIIIYILNACEKAEEDYVKNILETKEGGAYMSIAQKLKEEGIQEGIEKGIQEGIEKGIIALKELYEEGIITKDVYEKRVRKLKDEKTNSNS